MMKARSGFTLAEMLIGVIMMSIVIRLCWRLWMRYNVAVIEMNKLLSRRTLCQCLSMNKVLISTEGVPYVHIRFNQNTIVKNSR